MTTTTFVRSSSSAQKYVKMGVLDDYGDKILLKAATPNLKEVPTQ